MLVYLVYSVLVYAVLALIFIVIAVVIFALTYAVLLIPSYFIFLVVVVRKQFVWSENTTATIPNQDQAFDNEAISQ